MRKFLAWLLLAASCCAHELDCDRCFVPKMIGMTNDQAWRLWEYFGFTNEGICYPAQFCESGHVVGQYPSPYSLASCRDTILILYVKP